MTNRDNLTAAAQCAVRLMDLTTLNEEDTNAQVIALCQQAKSPVGNTAAVCIYPHFIPLARKTLLEQGTPEIQVATVTNFPQGDEDIRAVLAETQAAIEYGADEIDVVFPYRALIAGNAQIGFDLVRVCKTACLEAGVLLKVIIESGELQKATLIRQASEVAIHAGADFIKTSTGKVSVNATLESAEIIMSVIREKNVSQTVGFKAAGGVRTTEEAAQYLALAERLLGKAWIDTRHFRFGASSLLNHILKTLGYDSSRAKSESSR